MVAVTIIPLLTPCFIKPCALYPLRKPLLHFETFVLLPLKLFYAVIFSLALDYPKCVLFVALILTVVSLRQMPVVCLELMPLMYTGITQVTFEAQPDTDSAAMRNIAAQVDALSALLSNPNG